MFTRAKTQMIDSARALPGRADRAFSVPPTHHVLGTPLEGPFPDDTESLVVAMGCFWGAERVFWRLPGTFTTAVGYTGGYTPNPTYEEVCSGRTGHTEAVLVVFRPAELALEEVLSAFWESHDPTQGMRQGNDVGTQYRSGIYTTTDRQAELARSSAAAFEERLVEGGYGPVTSEIASLERFWYAEAYHQQYLDKNPGGYCGLGGTGVTCGLTRG